MYVNSNCQRKRRPGLTKEFNSEYRSWLAMRQRCSNRRTVGWADYGGRGIKVCPRWQQSFAAFLADMGPKPSVKHSIDRKDTNRDYTPENCRWATKLDQARNCRSNRYVTFRGQTMCLSAWAEKTGLSESVIRARLNLGWSVKKTLTTKLNAQRRDQRELTFAGETLLVKRWAEIMGLNYTTLLNRLDQGWDTNDALTTPCSRIRKP